MSDNNIDSSPTKIPLTPSVQIKASNEEINRRMEAFMTRKRQQINEQNLREFCYRDITDDENEFSCARVDAAFVRQKDSKSHIKVHSIVNPCGPQTMDTSILHQKLKLENGIGNQLTPLEDRISSIENQIGVNKPVPKDVYQRLKQIEDRMLFLESVSPEYKNFMATQSKDTNQDPVRKKTYSSEELDTKLRKLQDHYVRKIN